MPCVQVHGKIWQLLVAAFPKTRVHTQGPRVRVSIGKSTGFRQPVHGYPPENNLASAVQVSMDTAVQPCEDRRVTRGAEHAPQCSDDMVVVGSNEARWVDDEQRGMVLAIHFLFEEKGHTQIFFPLTFQNAANMTKKFLVQKFSESMDTGIRNDKCRNTVGAN